MFVRQLTCNNEGDLLITVAVGPRRRPVTFLVDTGAQITALSWVEAERCGIPVQQPDSFKCLGENPDSAHDSGDIMALGEEDPVDTMVAMGPFQLNLLGMDVVKGKQWRDTQGSSWSFGAPRIRQLDQTPSAEVWLLCPALPSSSAPLRSTRTPFWQLLLLRTCSLWVPFGPKIRAVLRPPGTDSSALPGGFPRAVSTLSRQLTMPWRRN